LAAVAGLSLVMMRAETSGVTVSADIETPKQCLDSPKVDNGDFVLLLEKNKISITNITNSPAESVLITLVDVSNPQIKNFTNDFSKISQGKYYLNLSLGTKAAGEKIEIPFSYTQDGSNPCIQVQVSTDGIAYYPNAASINLK